MYVVCIIHHWTALPGPIQSQIPGQILAVDTTEKDGWFEDVWVRASQKMCARRLSKNHLKSVWLFLLCSQELAYWVEATLVKMWLRLPPYMSELALQKPCSCFSSKDDKSISNWMQSAGKKVYPKQNYVNNSRKQCLWKLHWRQLKGKQQVGEKEILLMSRVLATEEEKDEYIYQKLKKKEKLWRFIIKNVFKSKFKRHKISFFM